MRCGCGRCHNAEVRAIIFGMSAPLHQIHYAYADYLALEASSNVKHEFLGGQIYAMAGGTPEHAALAAAVIGLLFDQLRRGGCRAGRSRTRVVPSTPSSARPAAALRRQSPLLRSTSGR